MTRKKRYSAEFKREALRMKLRRTAITPSQATATRATKK
jgi:transposase-like protein